MNLWAVMLVRDEADVIEHTLRHVIAEGVAGVIVTDNDSTDETRNILLQVADDAPVPVVVLDDDQPHYQSDKTTRMARLAYEEGAEWVWPVDADEIGFHDSGARLVDAIDPDRGDVIGFDLYTYLSTLLDDPDEENPFRRMVYRNLQPQPLAKIIARAEVGLVIADGNHAARYATRGHDESTQRGFTVAHCPYRSVEQFIRKGVNGGRALEATNLPVSTGQHWREYYAWWQRGGDAALRRIYEEHFLIDVPSAHGMVHDPIPLKPRTVEDAPGEVKAWP